MCRLVDIHAIQGITTGPGRLSAMVSDPHCPWNEGAWRFETADGRLQVHQATGSTDCSLSIQALGALVYGTHGPGNSCFRGWRDPSPEVRRQMRTMFPRLLPHLHEVF